MDIKRSGSHPSGKGPAEYFTGTVRVDPLFQAHDPSRAPRGRRLYGTLKATLVDQRLMRPYLMSVRWTSWPTVRAAIDKIVVCRARSRILKLK